MTDEQQRPIIIKRKKHKHEEAHSSAWKVALADFAIAMMAFFLLMWLINMATQDERRAISGYFEKPEEFTPPSDLPPSSVIISKEKEDIPKDQIKQREDIGHYKNEKIKEVFAHQEREKLENLMALIEKKIDENPVLKQYKEHIKLDMTEIGLRVQVIDQEDRSMFDRSSDMLQDYAVEILKHLAQPLNEVHNRISISGHTDAHKFVKGELTNWELSANRANAARRALLEGGLSPGKVARVVGLADTILYFNENPRSAVNRRISIIILTREQAFYE